MCPSEAANKHFLQNVNLERQPHLHSHQGRGWLDSHGIHRTRRFVNGHLFPWKTHIQKLSSCGKESQTTFWWKRNITEFFRTPPWRLLRFTRLTLKMYGMGPANLKRARASFKTPSTLCNRSASHLLLFVPQSRATDFLCEFFWFFGCQNLLIRMWWSV